MLRYERSLWLPLDAICSVELDIRLREWWNFDTLNGDTALTFDEWKLNFDDAWATLTEEQMGLRSLETIHASGKSMFIVEPGTCTGDLTTTYDDLVAMQTSIPLCDAQRTYAEQLARMAMLTLT